MKRLTHRIDLLLVSRETKVTDTHGPRSADEDVRRFQIAMHNVLRVKVAHPFTDLEGELELALRRKLDRRLAKDIRAQSIRAKFLHDVQV